MHEIKKFACLALANLATEAATHKDFIGRGMLGKLVSLSNADHPEICQIAAFSLVLLASNSRVSKTVTEEGGLEAVLYLARTDNIDDVLGNEGGEEVCCPPSLALSYFRA